MHRGMYLLFTTLNGMVLLIVTQDSQFNLFTHFFMSLKKSLFNIFNWRQN